MTKEFIIAIELGSSKMTGIAGQKNLDGSITILAVAKEDSTSCIRKGVVYNLEKTTIALTNLVKKLKNMLKTEIAKVYVGVGGQSLRGIKNTIVREMPQSAVITQDVVDSILDSNRAMTYPEQEILDAAIQEYKVDAQYQIDPVGIQCHRLEGNFLNILWRAQFYRNLKKCLENANIHVAEMYLSPMVLADNVLTDAERRAGCVLVDLGAETTTVAVFYRDKLRNVAVIPLGSGNITKDLESLQMDETEAERLKLKYGSAYTDVADIDPSAILPIDSSRTVESRKFIEVVEARTLEIIENVKSLIPTEYADKLLGGVVLTGGGSNMKNIEKAFRVALDEDKVRVAKFVTINIDTKNTKPELRHDGTMNTILSLVAHGDMNCAGNPFSDNLFSEQHFTNNPQPAEAGFATQTVTASTNTTAAATAQRESEEARRKREEEERRAKEEEERRQREEEERRAKEEEERKKNSPFRRIWGSMKQFGRSLVEPETNE